MENQGQEEVEAKKRLSETEGNELPEEEVQVENEQSADKAEGASEDNNNSEASVEQLREQEEDWKAKYYYLAAEMENLKKRHRRDAENTAKYSNEKVLSDLLDVLDNFERITMSLANDEDEKVKNIVFGIDMVQKQFVEALGKHGLKAIETGNTKFDPNIHEAVAQEEVEGKESEEIVKEMQKGYMLNERVLRASKVVIAK